MNPDEINVFESVRQWSVTLSPEHGKYHNFVLYELPRMLDWARLISRFDLGHEHCVLVFERLYPIKDNHQTNDTQ